MSTKFKNSNTTNDVSNRMTPNCLKYKKLLEKKDESIPKYSIQIVEPKELTSEWFHTNGFLSPILVKNNTEEFGLKVPCDNFTLDDVANILGDNFPIKIIEVGTQNQLDNWTIGDFARYLSWKTKYNRILNMISLEFSATGLNRDVYAPKVVTDVDWIDTLWPIERRVRGDFPHVQKYCLCGMAGSYTDFHLDFGGTSVWYHIIRGKKRFYFIRPTIDNLNAFVDWTNMANQDQIFFGDIVGLDNCMQIDISAGQTLLLPGGWIHAVFTPEDSLVFGGNFLLSSTIYRQLQVSQIEETVHVHKLCRFPYFRQMAWYAITTLLIPALTMYSHLSHGETQDSSSMKKGSEPSPPQSSSGFDWLSHPLTSRILREWILLIQYSESWLQLQQQIENHTDVTIFESAAAVVLSQLQIPSSHQDDNGSDRKCCQQVISLWWQILQTMIQYANITISITERIDDSNNCVEQCRKELLSFMHWIRGKDLYKNGDSNRYEIVSEKAAALTESAVAVEISSSQYWNRSMLCKELERRMTNSNDSSKSSYSNNNKCIESKNISEPSNLVMHLKMKRENFNSLSNVNTSSNRPSFPYDEHYCKEEEVENTANISTAFVPAVDIHSEDCEEVDDEVMMKADSDIDNYSEDNDEDEDEVDDPLPSVDNIEVPLTLKINRSNIIRPKSSHKPRNVKLVLNLSQGSNRRKLPNDVHRSEEEEVSDGRRYRTRGKRLSAAYLEATVDAEVNGDDSDDDDYDGVAEHSDRQSSIKSAAFFDEPENVPGDGEYVLGIDLDGENDHEETAHNAAGSDDDGRPVAKRSKRTTSGSTFPQIKASSKPSLRQSLLKKMKGGRGRYR